jgi:hypothetical protein
MKHVGMLLRTGRGRCVLGSLLMSALVVVPFGNRATAQKGDVLQKGQYLTEASLRLNKLIGKAVDDGYVFEDDRCSFGGGWLNHGENNWVKLYTLPLKAGTRYRFLASGDADVLDLDLRVQNKDGRTVAEDVGTAPEAIVEFQPEASGPYLVSLRLYDSKKELGKKVPCMCLAVVMIKK